MREKEDEQNSSARDGSADPFGKFPRRMDPRFPGMVFLGSVDGPGFILNKLRVRFAEKAKEVVDYLVGRFGGEPSCAKPVRNYSHWLTNKASAAMVLVRLVLSESATATERCAEWDADLGHDSGAFNVFFKVAQAPDAVVLDGEFVRMRKELELEGMLFADEAARILARRRQDRKMAEASVADGVACLVGEKRARAERLAKFGKLGAKTIREMRQQTNACKQGRAAILKEVRQLLAEWDRLYPNRRQDRDLTHSDAAAIRRVAERHVQRDPATGKSTYIISPAAIKKTLQRRKNSSRGKYDRGGPKSEDLKA